MNFGSWTFLLLGDKNQNLEADLDAENEADTSFFGIVRGLRRNSIYRPVIEVVTSVSLNQNSKVKVRKSAALNGLQSFQYVLIFFLICCFIKLVVDTNLYGDFDFKWFVCK